jgi:putative alpha-1,2-mannosidase
LRRVRMLVFALLLSQCLSRHSLLAQSTSASNKRPLAYANGLVGTAPLDDQKLIGNAPPPGEQIYSGFTSPGAVLPHGSTDLAPINANLDLQYVMGVPASYYYPNRTMFGFSSGAPGGPTLMPVVGDWTAPPQRSFSVYSKAAEKASPGYYSVYLDDFNTRAEMTVTTWTGLYRFTFPATDAAHILLDLGRMGGDIEVVGDHMVSISNVQQTTAVRGSRRQLFRGGVFPTI